MWRRSSGPRPAGRASAILAGGAGGPGTRTAGRLDGWTAGRLDGWTAGRLDGWTAGRLDGWTAGRLDGWTAENAPAVHLKLQGELPRVRTCCPQISQMKNRLFPDKAGAVAPAGDRQVGLNCLSSAVHR